MVLLYVAVQCCDGAAVCCSAVLWWCCCMLQCSAVMVLLYVSVQCCDGACVMQVHWVWLQRWLTKWWVHIQIYHCFTSVPTRYVWLLYTNKLTCLMCHHILLVNFVGQFYKARTALVLFLCVVKTPLQNSNCHKCYQQNQCTGWVSYLYWCC